MATTVQCLGVFRELGDSFVVECSGHRVSDLRTAVEAHLHAIGRGDLVSVLKRSVFASDEFVLRDQDPNCPDRVSLLPPVAGG